ncbi:MAG: TonB-dependent receptor plug domain-containing protein, partial [Nitrospira sp.]|nr:TonB-dependent receptor plug domain-containing protein [Nitrospira sp.]
MLSSKHARLLTVLLFIPIPSVFPQTSNSSATTDEELVELPAFVISTEGDDGYFSKNTMMGTRTSERLVNIPQSIQIVNSEFLSDLNLDNGVDSFKYAVSGINKREATSGDTYIRGFRVGGNSFLRNGVKFRGNMNIPLYDIDRIEIIKGPAALLFGIGAGSGGVVNYISKTASDKSAHYVKGTYGSFNAMRAEAGSSGPIGDTGLSYRVTVAATDADGRRDFDYFKDQFISTALDWKISDRSILSFYYDYYFLDQIVSTESIGMNGQFLDISPSFSPQESWVDAPRYTQFVSAQLITELSSTFQVRVHVNGSEQNFNFHQIFASRVPDANGDMARYFQNYAGRERAANLEIDSVKSFQTGSIAHKLTVGGALKYQRTKTHYDNVPITPINVYNPVYGTVPGRPGFQNGVAQPGGATNNSAQRSTEATWYVQEQANLMQDKIILIAGVAWQGVNTYRKNNFNGSLTDQIDHAYVKRYGAIFKPANWVSLYYNYSETVSFYNSTFEGGPRDGQILDPSITSNNEVGIKAETSDGLLFGGITVFDLNKTNDRFRYIQPDGSRGTDQRGEVNNQGWEADIGMGFKNPLGRAQAILTYYDGDSVDSSGNIPSGVTNEMWSFFLTQRISEGSANGLKFGAGLYHSGAFTLGSASGQLVAFTQPAYTTSTAFVSYQQEKYEVKLSVDNLSDKKFAEGGDGAGVMNMSLG